MTAPEITPLGTCERTGGPTHYGWHPRMASCLRWTQTLPAPAGDRLSTGAYVVLPNPDGSATSTVVVGSVGIVTDIDERRGTITVSYPSDLTPVSEIVPSVLGAIARGEG